MTRWGGAIWRGMVGLGLGLAHAGPVWADTAKRFDPVYTQVGFELRTRWGQRLEGRFTRYEGQVHVLADGRHQVQLRMFTESVEIVGYPRYTEWARGEKFFEAQRYPIITFTSLPYAPQLLRDGGALEGSLNIRGISRAGNLDVAPSTCARPAMDCDVVATGAVRRSDYEMDDWKLAVSDRVVFKLRARLQDETRQ